MTQAGMSTVFCVLPLIMLNSYPPLVFLRAIGLVVTLGLVHGLWCLPVVLCALPNWLTGGPGCCGDATGADVGGHADEETGDTTLNAQLKQGPIVDRNV
jgi:hypothetical protein